MVEIDYVGQVDHRPAGDWVHGQKLNVMLLWSFLTKFIYSGRKSDISQYFAVMMNWFPHIKRIKRLVMLCDDIHSMGLLFVDGIWVYANWFTTMVVKSNVGNKIIVTVQLISSCYIGFVYTSLYKTLCCSIIIDEIIDDKLTENANC